VDAIQTGHHLTGWEETATGVRARFVQRRTGEPRADAEGSLLIAADGIHSVARSVFYPNEGAPIWNGAILWRGITTGQEFLDGRTMVMVGHGGQKFVAYPISRESPVVNWIAERKFPAGQAWRSEDWNRRGDLEEFLPQFEKWRFDWLNVPAIIRGAARCFEYPMVDRDPVDRWTFGRVTLLGDAAHAMYPIGSNGASQAILDARVLAREIQTNGVTPAALHAYEAERRPATARIVLANRGNGPDQVMEVVHERAPDGFHRIEDVLSRAELEEIAAGYKRVAGFDKDALNARSPIVTPPIVTPSPR
jgi:2-polyprenyl-6-methoxyphenol hydroxylase-like FAD-dependent oxidoreductase